MIKKYDRETHSEFIKKFRKIKYDKIYKKRKEKK